MNDRAISAVIGKVLEGLPSLVLFPAHVPGKSVSARTVLFGNRIPFETDSKLFLLESILGDPEMAPYLFPVSMDEASAFEDNSGGEIELAHLISAVQEHALQYVFDIMIRNPGYHKASFTRMMRQTWELISGRVLEHPVPSDRHITHQWQRIRSSLSFEIPRLVEQFLPEMPEATSHILWIRHPLCVLMQLREHAAKALMLGSSARLSLEDVETRTLVANPFAETVLRVLALAEDVMPQVPQKDEDVGLDRAFLREAGRYASMKGRGAYRNFSVGCHHTGSGTLQGRICMSLGGKPFLQQVSDGPVFVFWDLQKYPITVCVSQEIRVPGREEEWRLSDAQILVHCTHRSISRHAFVQALDDSGTLGAICTEDTLERTLSLHGGFERFDPVLCLLDHMRSAGRILKYGVRARDRSLPQHNPYSKVPPEEYQAFIVGWNEAKDFARRHNADIVPYMR